jgi:hypothetical protein
MHFLRTLVFSAVFCASAAFAATIRVGDCNGAAEKDIEIDIKVHHEQPAEVSEQLVVSNDKLPLITHTHVILCIYAFSMLHSSLTKNLYCPPGIECVYNVECQNHDGCKWCRSSDYTVSFGTVPEWLSLANNLICMIYSANPKWQVAAKQRFTSDVPCVVLC